MLLKYKRGDTWRTLDGIRDVQHKNLTEPTEVEANEVISTGKFGYVYVSINGTTTLLSNDQVYLLNDYGKTIDTLTNREG